MNHPAQTARVLIGGVSSLILTMGIARFTYTPALPRMQEALQMDDSAAGLLAALNFAGYLSGALLASRIGGGRLKLQLFRAGLVLALLCNALLPLGDSLSYWGALRYLSGLSSAAGMVLGTSLVLEYLARHAKRPLIGVHFGGVGVGIVLTALALGSNGMAWQMTWWMSALIGSLFLLPAWYWVVPSTAAAAPEPASAAPYTGQAAGQAFRYLAASYFFAGGSFAVGTTFILAVIEADPLLAPVSGSAWLLLGLAAAPSCYLWVRWAGQFSPLQALLAAWLVQTAGLLLPLHGSAAATLAGALLFGFTFMGIVAMVLGHAGKLAQDNPARLMGLLVTSYGVGQIVGPLIAGQVMTFSAEPTSALWLAGGLSAAGALLAIGSGEQERKPEHACAEAG
ncbi:MAG: YbfB/YjiJ family MFS transporter [Sedimenticola sp.]|nr:YbfB/YjiJ family MFS transporter [Sedimenticola sp.]